MNEQGGEDRRLLRRPCKYVWEHADRIAVGWDRRTERSSSVHSKCYKLRIIHYAIRRKIVTIL